ncbi:MAG: hypothetical protein ACFCUN_11545 [Hyphomicrobiaceae bacterium]
MGEGLFGLNAAATGALIGFLWGALCYLWLTPVLIDRLEAWTGERQELARSLLWTDIVGYPLAGCLIGLLMF